MSRWPFPELGGRGTSRPRTSAPGPAACAVVAPRGAGRVVGRCRSSSGAGVSGTRSRLPSPSSWLRGSRGPMTWPHRDGSHLEPEPGLLAVGRGGGGGSRRPVGGSAELGRRQPRAAVGGSGPPPGCTATVQARASLPAVRFLLAPQASSGPWRGTGGRGRAGTRLPLGTWGPGRPVTLPVRLGPREPREAPPRGQRT